MFDSPFNARLQHFNSIFDSDEPFGRVGSFDEILDKVCNNEAVMWRDEIVIPTDGEVKLGYYHHLRRLEGFDIPPLTLSLEFMRSSLDSWSYLFFRGLGRTGGRAFLSYVSGLTSG